MEENHQSAALHWQQNGNIIVFVMKKICDMMLQYWTRYRLRGLLESSSYSLTYLDFHLNKFINKSCYPAIVMMYNIDYYDSMN